MSRNTLLAVTACVLSMPLSAQAQYPAPGGSSDGACPISVIAEFPQGGGGTLCMWELSDCTASPPSSMGYIYSSCEGDVCSCVNGNCQPGTVPVAVEPSPPVTVEDEVIPPAAQLLQDTDPIVSASAKSVHILTSAALNLVQAGRQKQLRSNKRNISRIVPAASKLIPAAANTVTTFGKGNYKVKYLKALKFTVGTTDEYYALFKVYDDKANPNGGQDLASDRYVGLRISQPTQTPGGLVAVNSNAAGRVTKLPPFTGGHVREVAVRIRINRAANGNPLTWFHLFGTVM